MNRSIMCTAPVLTTLNQYQIFSRSLKARSSFFFRAIQRCLSLPSNQTHHRKSPDTPAGSDSPSQGIMTLPSPSQPNDAPESDSEPDPYPDMDIDAALRYLIEADGDQMRVPPHILLGAGYREMTENGLESEESVVVEAEIEDDGGVGASVDEERRENGNGLGSEEESDEENVEFGYEALSDGPADMDDGFDEMDDGSAESEQQTAEVSDEFAIFTIELASALNNQLAEPTDTNTTTTQPNSAMGKDDELIIRSVMGSLDLQPPQWAQTPEWESKLEKIVSSVTRPNDA